MNKGVTHHVWIPLHHTACKGHLHIIKYLIHEQRCYSSSLNRDKETPLHFAAYSEIERREVKLWRENKDGAHDWSPFFKYIVNKLEGGEMSKDGWKEREHLLHHTMKAIIPCDIPRSTHLGSRRNLLR